MLKTNIPQDETDTYEQWALDAENEEYSMSTDEIDPADISFEIDDWDTGESNFE